MSLRLRIIVVYAVLVVASFSGIIWLIISDVRPRYLEAVEDATVDTAELLAVLISQQVTDGVIPLDAVASSMRALEERRFHARIFGITKKRVDLNVYITDRNGILLYDSRGLFPAGTDFSRWNDVFLTLRGQYGARSTRTDPDDPTSSVLYIAAPIVKGGELYGVVSVGKPTNSVSFLISIAQKRFLFSLLLVGFTALCLSVGLSFWITHPLRKLTAYARSIQMGQRRPLPPLGRSEMALLGHALEDMQDKLEGKNYIEDYVRALTYELKSPITGIKGAAEILREDVDGDRAQKFLGNIDSEAERLHSLVDRMLQLSRLENVRSISRVQIEGFDFFWSVAESFQPRLVAKKMEMDLDVAAELAFEADELLLRQAVANLVSNSIDFSPPESHIRLSAFMQDAVMHITVQDSGTGIPDFALKKVFEKFFSLGRPDSGKKSSGLGLPFVAEVAALHGGRVELENLHPGLKAQIIVPVSGRQ